MCALKQEEWDIYVFIAEVWIWKYLCWINHQTKSKKVKRKMESNITKILIKKNSGKDVWFCPWIADKEVWPSPFGAHFHCWRSPLRPQPSPPPKKKRTFPKFNNLVSDKKVFKSFWKHSLKVNWDTSVIGFLSDRRDESANSFFDNRCTCVLVMGLK